MLLLFYSDVYNTINQFDSSLFVINYTEDCWALMLNGNKKVKLSPWYFPSIEDTNQLNEIVAAAKAIVLSTTRVDIPEYAEILARNWPIEIPWVRGTLHIAIPRSYMQIADNGMLLQKEF